jgi:hypothetical protein
MLNEGEDFTISLSINICAEIFSNSGILEFNDSNQGNAGTASP